MKKRGFFLVLLHFFFFESCAPPSFAKEGPSLETPQKVVRSRSGTCYILLHSYEAGS
jgi:hypothetical protein